MKLHLDALDCYTCTNATYVFDCTSKTTCNTGEKCGTVIQNGNNIGSGSIVGRSGVTGPCSECCKEQHFSAEKCADSTDIHCATVGAVVDMCSDTDKARAICRRFCGLCNYVNGGWSTWFSWSNCDVTCGSGTQTRTRNCSEPVPSGGGHYCVGASHDTQTCTKEPCPIHGSWADWATWGSCSATCGIGLKRRDRTCSNPYPARFGDNCYGDARDDQLCLADTCADGGWSLWLTWSTCSRTCGDGIRTRSRSCDNPLPSIQGQYCLGDPYQVETCNMKSCPVTNGDWGSWTAWTSCTASCSGGMQSRLRHCDNPKPSADGDVCDGSPLDVRLCNQQQCPRKKASFSVSTASRGNEGILRFSKVHLNEGSAYDITTGIFTCTFPGLYVFIANIIEGGVGNNELRCAIRKDGSVYESMHFLPGDVDGRTAVNGYGSVTGSAGFHLVQGSRVDIYCHTGTSLSYSSFTGFLVDIDP